MQIRTKRATLALGLGLALGVTTLSVPPTSYAGDARDGDRGMPQTKIRPGSEEATQFRQGRASVSQLAVRPKVDLAPCEEEPDFLCGTIDVPVDRAHPNGRQISLGFMVLPHANPDSTATDALVSIDGGPGFSATASRGFLTYRVGPSLADRDLILVDNRGTGMSEPIYCPSQQDLPYIPDQLVDGIGECGRQLGRDSDRYGAGDIALDLEQVRRALGYPRLTIDALSYGSVDAQAYAYRFPQRVRAMVLDGGMPVSDAGHEWSWGRRMTDGLPRVVGAACEAAPECARQQPDRFRALAQLARLVRHHPFTGRAVGLDGEVHRVRVDEYRIAVLSRWDYAMAGEIAAATDALRAGDRKPIVRLLAEADEEFVPDPIEQVSWGANVAGQCNDLDFVWKRTDPIGVRKAKYRAALRDIGPRAFRPFSHEAWLTEFAADFCLKWPAPDRFVPAVPTGKKITGVPTLILTGRNDGVVPTETSEELLEIIPGARLIEVSGAAHPSVGWNDCARALSNQFLSGQPLTPECADDEGYVPAATGLFPRRATKAPQAHALPGDATTRLDRRVLYAAVGAVRDVWARAFRTPFAEGSGAGLRGGRFDYVFLDADATIEMTRVRFARDVVVRGSGSMVYDTNASHFEIVVKGPTGRATLIGDGAFGFGAPYDDFVVTGEIGGRTVAVSVPAN